MTNCPKDFISKFLLFQYSCPYISVRERIFLTVKSVLKKRGKQSTVRKFWSPSSFVGLENPLRILNINSLLYKTNRFQVAVRLFNNRSQMTSKCSKNTFLFLPHFDVICNLLLNRCTATWNLFVN